MYFAIKSLFNQTEACIKKLMSVFDQCENIAVNHS